MYYRTTYESPLGFLTLASEGSSLVGLWLENQKYFGGTVLEEMVDRSDLPIFDKAKAWLDRYFAGEKPAISELPLAPIGSEFRHTVWSILCEIPYGETITYGEIAKKLADKLCKRRMSAQAVGGAVGHNSISIIIPCHRVVGSGGSLIGYAGGIDKKIWLLTHEGVETKPLTVPQKGTAL